MSLRKKIDEVKGAFAAEELEIRAKQEAKVFELGVPLCPEQFIYTNKRLYEIWNVRVKMLLEKRLLAFSDGEPLLEFCKAQLLGNRRLMEEVVNSTWAQREPFPDPCPPTDFSLPEFIASVKAERDSFPMRMREGSTVCLDSTGAEYGWPEGDGARVARDYCLAVHAGQIAAGELMRRACTRFLGFIDEGCKRGFHFDPVAVRNMVAFAKNFCGLENLMPWQTWVLAAIFGFKRPWGGRLTTEAWVSMGRKNGKTRFASMVGLFMLIADQEKYPEIYAASCAKEQSRIVWKDARRAVTDNAELAAHVHRFAGELAIKETDATFKPLASEEKSFLGTRPSGVIADEVAAWTDRLAWDTLIQGQVSKQQPLILAITTAGGSKQSFGWEKFSWAEKILRGIVEADHVFAAIYSIDATDSPKDLAALKKSNPSLGITINEENLAKQIAALDENPTALSNFLQFHANVYPDISLTRVGSIPAPKWDKCAGLDLIGDPVPWAATIKFLEMNYETPCMGGLDVGLSSDMSCYAQLWPRARFAAGGDLVDKKVLVAQFFMPELGLLEKERAWNVPLSAWARTGWIQLLPGDMTDPREIRKFILQMASRFVIREIGFDSWNAQVLCAEVNESGAAQCVAVPQTAKELTAPARELLTAVNNGDLLHLGNPVLAWHAGNVILKEDERHGGTKPEKLSYNEKIDGISATLNAWHRLLANPITESVYNNRGLLLI